MNEHSAYFQRQFEAGKLLLYGPVMAPDGAFGLAILEVGDEAEARQFGENDPSVRAGLNGRPQHRGLSNPPVLSGMTMGGQPSARRKEVQGRRQEASVALAGRVGAHDGHVVVVISAALRQPARAPCSWRTSPASSGRLDRSALRAARARRRRAAVPATGRPPTRTSCGPRHAQATRVVTSWSSQPLPSGSLKETNER